MTAPGMRASFKGILVLAVTANLGVACSGGKAAQGYPDGSFTGTGGRATTDAGSGTGSGGTGVPDASTGDGPTASGSTRIFSGLSLLLPSPGISCSFTATGTAPADQWCGMLRPGATAGTVSLWVFNLTKALAGTPLTCAAGDANCILVSSALAFTPDMGAHGNHGFVGGTLVYYEQQSVFAWKPGWSAGRIILANDQPATCAVSPDGSTAICLKLIATDTTIQNLYAGRVDTQTGPALTLIEPISSTVGGVSFSPDSQSILWSTATATGPEILKMQTIGDAASRRTVATNVTRWSPSPDGTRWLWLSQPVLDTVSGAMVGTLQSAPFPDGTAPRTIQTATLDYAFWATKSAAVLANPGAAGADLRAITDIDNPTTTTRMLATQTALQLADLDAAGDILYSDDAMADPMRTGGVEVNFKAVTSTGTGACTVTLAPNAINAAQFVASGQGVSWVRITDSGATRTLESVLTTLADCVSRTVTSTPAAFPLDVGPGMVFQDNLNMTTSTARLSFAAFASDGTLGVPTVIHASADPDIQPLFPNVPRVLYSVAPSAFEGGIYASATLSGAPKAFMPQTQAADVATGGIPSARPIGGLTPFARSAQLGRQLRPQLGRQLGMPLGRTGILPVAHPASSARWLTPPQRLNSE